MIKLIRWHNSLTRFLLLSLCVAGLMTAAHTALAFEMPDGYEAASRQPPPTLAELERLAPIGRIGDDDLAGLPFNIRNDAMREAALSYGARGGLVWRTYHIRDELEGRRAYLDKVFDFRNLLIAAPSGFLIEPPIITEQINAMLVEAGGMQAAVADRVFEINKNARIVSAPRHWRNYLEREWGDIATPPDILRPQNEEERHRWARWVREGWDQGVEQADEIFEDDLNQLTSDYQGMVRYRMLLAQGMVSPPYAIQVDRGITGGGATMRVGDRSVEITGMPELKPGARTWQPASR